MAARASLKDFPEMSFIMIDALLLATVQHFHLKARYCLKKGNHSLASKYLKRSTILNPLHCERLVEFGEALLKINKPQEASTNFRKALDIHPQHAGARMGLGTSQFLLGNHNEALNLIKDLSNEQERASVFNNAAILCVRQRDFPPAHKLYDIGLKILKHGPILAKVTFNKSLAFFKEGDKAKGMEWLVKAIELDPKFARASDFLAYHKAKPNAPSKGDWVPIDEEELEDLDVSNLDETF